MGNSGGRGFTSARPPRGSSQEVPPYNADLPDGDDVLNTTLFEQVTGHGTDLAHPTGRR